MNVKARIKKAERVVLLKPHNELEVRIYWRDTEGGVYDQNHRRLTPEEQAAFDEDPRVIRLTWRTDNNPGE
jgi:hypothetical protein